MVYVVCFTQFLTVIAALVALRWYLDDREQGDRFTASVIADAQKSVTVIVAESDRTLRELIDAHQKQLERTIKQAQHEREMLLERYQFPEDVRATAMAAAPEAAAVQATSRVMDEAEMFRLEHPDLPTEEPPTLFDKPPVVQPIQPVTPFGARS